MVFTVPGIRVQKRIIFSQQPTRQPKGKDSERVGLFSQVAPPSGVAEREETSRNDEWSVPFLSISRCKLTIAARVSLREKAKKKERIKPSMMIKRRNQIKAADRPFCCARSPARTC